MPAVDARELQLQALDLEHRGPRLLAAGLHDQLGQQRLELRIVVRGRLAVGCDRQRVAQVSVAQVPGGAAQQAAREVLVEVERRERRCALVGARDAEGQEGALCLLAP